MRQSKDNLRREIETLKRQQRSSDKVLSALVRSDLWEEVLSRLRSGQPIEAVSEWLSNVMPEQGGAAGGEETMRSDATRNALGLTASTAQHGVGGEGGDGGRGGDGSGSGAGEVAGTGGMSGGGTGGWSPLPPIGSLFTGGRPYLQGPQFGSLGRQVVASPVSAYPEQLESQRRDVGTPHSSWTGHIQSESYYSTPGGSHQTESMDWSPVTAGSMHNISGWVAGHRSHANQVQPRPGGSYGEEDRTAAVERVLGPEVPEVKVAPCAWTKVTDDSRLVEQLLALYFCWEYPTFASLSKEHFLKDFQDGRTRYCSSILVNALLALGCRFSSKPEARAREDDPRSSGDHFFAEALRLLRLEKDQHTLTTIQALGIMSIREASCGRDSESWYYSGQSIKLAIEMGLHRITGDGADDDEMAVKSATFWGAISLDHAWSLATGTLPQLTWTTRLPPKPAIINDIEASRWFPFTDDGTQLPQTHVQPSNVRSVYKCFCELTELVHETLYILYTPGRRLMSRDIVKLYTKYLGWYDNIPEVLRLGHNFVPSVLFAHMYYHFAILLLFRPFLKLRMVGSHILPRDVCSQAADAIQNLTRSYDRLYTLRRTPSFVPYFVLTSAIMHLVIGATTPTDKTAAHSSLGSPQQPREGGHASHRPTQPVINQHSAQAIRRGIADLAAMAPCHLFAEQALNILCFLAKRWGLEVPIVGNLLKLEEDLHEGKDQRGRSDEAFEFKYDEASTRPKTSSYNFFAPNVAESDLVSSVGPVTDATRRASAGGEATWVGEAAAALGQQTRHDQKQYPLPRIDDDNNPLFWPFPMQGRPLLPVGKELHEAGFEML